MVPGVIDIDNGSRVAGEFWNARRPRAECFGEGWNLGQVRKIYSIRVFLFNISDNLLLAVKFP